MKCLKPPPPTRKPRHKRIVALCGDTQVGLWMVRCLSRRGLEVYAVCRSPQGLSAHSRYAAGAWMLTPNAAPQQLVDELHALAVELDAGSIMPISEGYHATLIAQREQFEPDIHLFSPARQQFDKATNKDYMQSLCRELGVPVAKGATLDKLIADGGESLRFPLVLRTSRQNDKSTQWAPWKAAYARDKNELLKLHDQVASLADNVVVQEYHPGVEDHVQILMHQNQPFMVGEYIGEHHMPLAGGVTVQRVSCRHERLIHDAVRLLQAIGWDGIAGVQFHYDTETNQYIFLEINPRFIGGLPTVIMAGFEAPFLLWQSWFEPEKMSPTTYQLGLRTRILGGDANWMIGMVRGDELPPGQKRLHRCSAAARFLFNCGPWTKDDVFLLGDLKPFWVDCHNMVRRLGAKSFDIIGQA
ncbi:MAG: ATP-grasp domain-containing protein [Sedimentisphaerales bacterium]|nr:ATP-grasp domain-containing protein [Sedimentisphaerales bacterium]